MCSFSPFLSSSLAVLPHLNVSFTKTAKPEPKQPSRAFGFPRYVRDGKEGIPEPEDCLPTEDRLKRVLEVSEANLSRKVKEVIQRYRTERSLSAIEVRNCDQEEYGDVVTTKNDAEKEPSFVILPVRRVASEG